MYRYVPALNFFRNAGVGCSSHPGGTTQSPLQPVFRCSPGWARNVPPNGAYASVRVGSETGAGGAFRRF